jgi:hypothetical protein
LANQIARLVLASTGVCNVILFLDLSGNLLDLKSLRPLIVGVLGESESGSDDQQATACHSSGRIGSASTGGAYGETAKPSADAASSTTSSRSSSPAHVLPVLRYLDLSDNDLNVAGATAVAECLLSSSLPESSLATMPPLPKYKRKRKCTCPPTLLLARNSLCGETKTEAAGWLLRLCCRGRVEGRIGKDKEPTYAHPFAVLLRSLAFDRSCLLLLCVLPRFASLFDRCL